MPIHNKHEWNSAINIAAVVVVGFLLSTVLTEAKALPSPKAPRALALSLSQAPEHSETSPSSTHEQTWTGEITTAMCKRAGGSMGHDCILNCVKAGEKLVLITKGQVHEIANQDLSELTVHAGHRVKLTGSTGPDGKMITVTKVEMVSR